MKKIDIMVTFEDEKLDALEYVLKKENTTVKKKLDEALRQLYEQAVPEAVREYLDHKAIPVRDRSRRPAKTPTPPLPAGRKEESQHES
ncbi:hypothetical protein DWV16_00220 [Anaerotruncus sp. AF02-27]|uniref:DUF6103 family protein n=1 Tax=Anaerotruncus TaxID=244127 RepID=UPI000E53A83D|nr:DUF6103 family protein [Anaerotruncus sp. AF02-27]RGX56790.1 hypothetical protein DWV16_00220 [Anaerotruncus sp. AF02-27]